MEWTIGTYSDPDKMAGYTGYIENPQQDWILYFDQTGRPAVYYRRRDPRNGAAIENLPEDRIDVAALAEHIRSPH